MRRHSISTHRYLRPEQELLVLCASDLPGAHPRCLELLEAGISWSNLLPVADRNEVLPLVYARLAGFAQAIPSAAFAILQKRCARIASWNLTLASELLVALGYLERNGIRALAFKGPALTIALYGQLGLRHCRDLDLLIEADRVWDAVRIFQAAGYLLAAPFPATPERAWLQAYKDVALRHPSTGVHLELHWAVCEPAFDSKIHSARLGQRTESVTVLGVPVPFPAPEDLLFLLAIHGVRHYWNSLKWIADIDRCIRTYSDLNWAAATQAADSLGRRKTFLLPVKLCQHLLATPLPGRLSSLVEQETGFAWLIDQISDNLFQEPGPSSAPDESLFESREAAKSDISKKLFRARSKDSLLHRLQYVLLLVRQFLQPDAEDRHLRRTWCKQAWLFCFIQPLRLIRAHGLKFFLRASKELFSAVIR